MIPPTYQRTVIGAKLFAMSAHGGQRYGDFQYTKHLDMVAGTLEAYGFHGYAIQAAAYLHDTIEDTATNYSDIKKNFGTDVAELVYAVTDELGRNRKERHAKTYPKIKGNEPATILKLADRLANVCASIILGQADKLEMYQKEHSEFCGALREVPAGLAEPLWLDLDGLIFGVPEKQIPETLLHHTKLLSHSLENKCLLP